MNLYFCRKLPTTMDKDKIESWCCSSSKTLRKIAAFVSERSNKISSFHLRSTVIFSVSYQHLLYTSHFNQENCFVSLIWVSFVDKHPGPDLVLWFSTIYAIIRDLNGSRPIFFESRIFFKGWHIVYLCPGNFCPSAHHNLSQEPTNSERKLV